MTQPDHVIVPPDVEMKAQALETKAQKLRESSYQVELGAMPANGKKSSSSKLIINGSFIVLGVVGIVGSFWNSFSMTKYVMFLETFAFIWAPLVVAVGGGMAVKNFVTKKYGE